MLLVHLSDIHFRRRDVTTALDPNFHLRNEIIRDLRELHKQLGPADLVIVSGDVAFAGHPEEYEFATEWFKEICKACGSHEKNVFVIPGNHDVDRELVDSSLVQLVHKDIKSTFDVSLNDKIGSYLRQPDTATLLYQSLRSYNEFASQFFCAMLPSERTRARRELALNDGSTLRVWGVNSAFVSSSADVETSLFVDPATFQITRHAGVVNVVATHHHPSWLRQRQAVEDHYNDVAQIQLFGHVHTNRIARDPHYVRLIAGAVQPDRFEPGWEPGYNLIELEVEGRSDARRLLVRTHVRTWQASPGQFRAKMDRGKEFFEHRIDLERWDASDAVEKVIDGATIPATDRPDEPPDEDTMMLVRELGVRFYGLSFSQKSEIAGRLALLEEEDMTQPDFERFRRVFIRASQRNQLNELKEAIEKAERQVRT